MKRRKFLQYATALGLTGAVNGLSTQGATEEGEVRGHVVAEGKPVVGARASDGLRVAVTDSSGQFSLPVGPESGPLLWLCVPAGYWTDQFYVPIATAKATPHVFRLSRGVREDSHRGVYMTDIHLGEGKKDQSYAKLAATIAEINELDPLPAFCWAGGDISLQGGQGDRYVALMKQLKMPVRNCVGNHEMLVREANPRGKFQQLFGPSSYSFDVGKVHYVTLDGCVVPPQGEGSRHVEGLVSPSELSWLVEDLKHVPEDVARVVAIHIPLVSNYPERRGTTAEKAPNWVVQNADEVIDVLARFGASLVLQGHLHENERTNQRGMEFVESISVCGRWWQADTKTPERGASGEPRGYRLLDVNGATVKHRYQSSAESRTDVPGELVALPAELPAAQQADLSVNIFDGTPETVVTARLDDHAPQTLIAGGGPNWLKDLQPAHHWRWSIPASELAPGKHLLRVQAKEPGQPAQTFEQSVTVV